MRKFLAGFAYLFVCGLLILLMVGGAVTVLGLALYLAFEVHWAWAFLGLLVPLLPALGFAILEEYA